MTKAVIILSGLLLASCGHMPKTEIKSTENDQYSMTSSTSDKIEATEIRNSK